jgi:hypothetical protein
MQRVWNLCDDIAQEVERVGLQNRLFPNCQLLLFVNLNCSVCGQARECQAIWELDAEVSTAVISRLLECSRQMR